MRKNSACTEQQTDRRLFSYNWIVRGQARGVNEQGTALVRSNREIQRATLPVLFFRLSSDRWVKIKLNLTTIPRTSIMCQFN